jgi:hypothetical protein
VTQTAEDKVDGKLANLQSVADEPKSSLVGMAADLNQTKRLLVVAAIIISLLIIFRH